VGGISRCLRVASWLQFTGRMQSFAWLLRLATLAGVVLLARAAHAQDTTGATLSATDFTLTLTRSDGHVLSSDELATYFSRARCACPTNLTATLAVSSDTAALFDGHTVDAQLMVGNDCDNVQVATCAAVGSVLTLSSASASTATSVTTSSIFGSAAGSCGDVTSSTRFWAIVRLDGARLSTEPSLALTLGGAGPAAPTKVATVAADGGLLVSWTPSGDSTTLQGHQVLCSPGAATASTPAYDLCTATGAGSDGGAGGDGTDGGANPFASFDPQFVCSGLVAAGTNSARVHGLENGRVYQIAVVAIGIDGTPSAPSSVATGTPAPTVGFGDLYKQSGGTAAAGCALGGKRPAGAAGMAAVALAILLRRRSRRDRGRSGRASGATFLVTLLAATAYLYVAAASARAQSTILDEPSGSTPGSSSRGWNFELRFGPYRPDIDSEFASRGQAARPYQQIFSSSRHLLTSLEIDRQVSQRGGTWAIGLGAGHFNVTAAALSADLSSRSGDQTGLRLIPLSASLVYRADDLRRRLGSPLVPYAKAGLDCTFWRMSDTSQPDISGHTFGWHAAAGVTFDLMSLDAESAETMRRESGVQQIAIFGEYALYRLDGFGSASALHVGDATWLAGIMFEL